ncbi:MAG: Kelch repeat-containing protein [Cyclobacteriaceae bacterium]
MTVLYNLYKRSFLLLATIGFISCSDDEPDVQWTEVSSLPSEFRTHHSFGFSLMGKGYLVTGDSGVPRADFYEYNPGADEWNRLSNYPGPARSYGIGDVWEGKAYLGFGADSDGDALNDLWVFDPTTITWTQLTSCPCEPRYHPAMVASKGKLFVGLGNNSRDYKDWWEYDIASDEWKQNPDLPGDERHHPYQFALGDYVYTGFGHGAGIYKNWFRYDPATSTWEQMADIPGEGRVAGTQFSFEGKGYVLSGDGQNHGPMETGEFWSYNPATNTWEELPPHPGKSRWAPASFIIDGEVYLINGTIRAGTALTFPSAVYKYKLNR